MKTQEQIKSEVLAYLNKTSQHLFQKENGEFYNVLVDGNNLIVINGDRVSVYDINKQIEWYGNNTKCVIKHMLFLNKKLKSIKNFKAMKERIKVIKEKITGKEDKNEIVKIIDKSLSELKVEDMRQRVDNTEEPKVGFFKKIFK